ncbi:class I adenylate-forming enzyme family protein [Cryptosporangium phraense]|uniref:Long-chain fatty acid--CoA ligase n=1 Tax=Cryptosporangium phraense TaxID=2593070 RepID=A0A545AKW1_9ACTN|nr:AMP-binding protein [Cryptosporangium phraense]TQS41921.1 long-chain fatty acid--CoA ligase [Cryptosporangium phraense]
MTSPSDSSWAHLVVASMERRRSDVAFRGHGVVRTHGESRDRAVRFAHALTARGVGPGSRVALVVEDRADAVEAYLGVGLTGATAVHVNDRLAGPEIAGILDRADASVVCATAGHLERVADLLRGSGTPLIALGLPSSEDLAASGSTMVPDALAEPDRPGIVGFTSGTTGTPKGVVHTHRNLARIVRHMPAHDGLRWGSRCGFTGTLAFVAGVWGVVLPHLYVGGEISFLAGLDPERWVDAMIRERTNFTYAPTPLMRAFAAEVRRRPAVLEQLDGVLHSGSLADRDTVADLVDAIGPRYVETYGMTETGAPVTATVPDDWRPGSGADDPYASAGRPVPIASVTVVGRDGASVPSGETGEIVVRSETLFEGYLGDPGATAEALPDGALRTGDLGALDDAGYLYVRGRLKDMIVTGGMNVYPAEVEQVLALGDGVAEVAVFGVSHPRWGETVTAAVVPRPGAVVDPSALETLVRSRLASYKKPTAIHVVESLPRTASLKVQKDELRKRFDAS